MIQRHALAVRCAVRCAGRCAGLALLVAALLLTAGPAPSSAAEKAKLEDLRIPVVKIIAISKRNVGVGTGFLVAPGTIATNLHVVGVDTDETRLFVLFRAGGKNVVYGGTKVAESRRLDLAIVKIKATSHPVLKITLIHPALDHPVYSIGYPAHLEAVDKDKLREAIRAGGGLRALLTAYVKELEQANVTAGNISKRDMSNWGFPTRSRVRVIFHTTKISGGNSGGPLVDRCGRVLGVNTRVLTAVRSSGTRDRTFAAYSQASQADDLVAFLKQNNVTFQQATDVCNISTPLAVGPQPGLPVYLWAIIGVLGLLTLSALGFAIVAPRRARSVATRASGAMTQMTRRMGTSLNRPTAPRIREIAITGPETDVTVGGAALAKGHVFGRDAALCDSVLSFGNASRRHFRLRTKGGRVVIEDLSSTNGTTLNGEALKPFDPKPLQSGAEVGVGSNKLTITIG